MPIILAQMLDDGLCFVLICERTLNLSEKEIMKQLFLILVLLVTTLATPVAAQSDELVFLYRDASDSSLNIYQDGTTTRLAEGTETTQYEAYFSPDGNYLAVITDSLNLNFRDFPEEPTPAQELGYDVRLTIYDVASLETLYDASLLTPDFIVVADTMFAMAQTFLRAFETIAPAIAWSPDSTRLAFITGTEGQVDADGNYQNGEGQAALFDVASGNVTLLEDVPGIATDFTWSPDSQALMFQGIDNFGTGAGFASTGLYIVGADAAIDTVPLPGRATVNLHGWLDADTFIFSEFFLMVGASGLFAYDRATDSVTTLVPLEQNNLDDSTIQVDPVNGAITFGSSDFNWLDIANIEGLYPPGTYIIDDLGAEPRLIFISEVGDSADFVEFVTPDTLYLFARVDANNFGFLFNIPDGELTPVTAPPLSAWSPDGTAVIYKNLDEPTPVLFDTLGSVYGVDGIVVESVVWLDNDTFIALETGENFRIVLGNRLAEFETLVNEAGLLAVAP